jgi:cytochrome c peroxidase
MTRHDSSLPGLLRIAGAALALTAALSAPAAHAQTITPSMSLKSVPVPGPSDAALSQFVQDKAAAIQLGKALFWDQRVGSDNKTACASCHFAAGADTRSKNQLSPGLLRLAPGPDKTFQLGAAPNYVLTAGDFPFTKHADINDASTRIADVNDVASSQGVFTTAADGAVSTSAGGPDTCSYVADDVLQHGGDGFNIGGTNTRRVEPRNSPSVINAVFNFRNFWDGRGNNVFNGGDPFGMRNPQAQVWKRINGTMARVSMALPFSSLASQGSGPPLSGTEMSCRNRAFVMLGQKLLDQNILGDQAIAPGDSMLGSFSSSNRRPTYRHLVKQAFRSELWNAPSTARFTNQDARAAASMDLGKPSQFRQAFGLNVGQAELNFSLFFSLAIQLYESTLVSDDTPFDRYASGDGKALTDTQKAGLSIFTGKGRCINCHGGAELTNASVRNVMSQRLERMTMGDGSSKVYDSGFYNIGVRPHSEDPGVGGSDPWGRPLSESLMVLNKLSALLGNDFSAAANPAPASADEVSVSGAFKAPGLRNVELTGPYFHNGGKATLMQVVDFYNRGGDFAAENRGFLAPDIEPIGLTEAEKLSLVSFLLALTDERVRWQKAPFDHPALCLPQGQSGNTLWLKPDAANPANAADDMPASACLPAVGAGGSNAPLNPFLSLAPTQH